MTLVRLESEGDVRTITLDAPDRRNALDWPLLEELAAAIASVAADDAARVLVVAGAGKAFCAGADLHDLFGDVERPVDELRDHLMRVYSSFLGLHELAIPTIAAVQGAAIGAGLNIALACDVIVAGPHARFGPTFSQIGLHPGGGCTWLLTRRIGAAEAAAALYSGDVIDAEAGYWLGIAQELVDDPLARAQELAALYAERDPTLMRSIKHTIEVARTTDLATTLAVEAAAQAETLRSEQFRAHMERFRRDE
ncbi:enoyl-CoA hydratase [Aeromicrobium terrae]|uniref:Enoyl-CoA hydratase n=1 Tax=Aeromicrobium terrae TaxID=2498846 RepID=A0A5C8NFZ4_9ACTN|nr:enoyl-CoA hydratase [Aeromicrobium terrae]TXL57679.1 enoyl-CoA hydratase [Aeromicrobium terrae]